MDCIICQCYYILDRSILISYATKPNYIFLGKLNPKILPLFSLVEKIIDPP